MLDELSEVYENEGILNEIKITGNVAPFPCYRITPVERKTGLKCLLYYYSKYLYNSVGDVYYISVSSDNLYLLDFESLEGGSNILVPTFLKANDIIKMLGIENVEDLRESTIKQFLYDKSRRISDNDALGLNRTDNSLGTNGFLRLLITIKDILPKMKYPNLYISALKTDPQRVKIYKNIIKTNIDLFGGIYTHIKDYENSYTSGCLLLTKPNPRKVVKSELSDEIFNQKLNERYKQTSRIFRLQKS
jgi:hypothetical protein